MFLLAEKVIWVNGENFKWIKNVHLKFSPPIISWGQKPSSTIIAAHPNTSIPIGNDISKHRVWGLLNKNISDSWVSDYFYAQN